MPDVKKLCDAYRWGRDHPENFNMNTWGQNDTLPGPEDYSALVEAPMGMCGTTACLAGTVVWQAGGKLLLTANEDGEGEFYGWSATDVLMPDGSVVDIEVEAEYILGLHHFDAYRLFHGRSLTDVRRAIVELFGVDPDIYGLEETADEEDDS